MVAQKVFIVGAGPSGLVCLKEMLEAGHDAMCIDASTHIGGVFSLKPGAIYEDLHLTISNYFMAYSDFPPLEDHLQYSTSEEYGNYLVRYMEHFELQDHIQLSTKIVNAKQGPWGTWQIKTMTADGRTEMHEADSLVVATGSNHIPTHPFSDVGIPVVHSSDYLDNKPFVGKKVLVCGMGESSGDIAAQISTVAEECTIWGRRTPLVAPRFFQSICDDKNYCEKTYLAPGKNGTQRLADYLESITISRISSGASFSNYGFARKFVWENLPGSPSWDILKTICLISAKKDPVVVDTSGVATKTGFYLDACARGDLNMVCCGDYEFRGSSVVFHNPEYAMRKGKTYSPMKLELDIDVIVACTGFKTDFQWLDADICPNPRTWYKHCFPPNYGEKLAFIGWARPHQGGIPVMAEMHSRYLALLLKGERQLPSDIAELTVIEAEQERALFHTTPNLNSLCDYVGMMHSLARLIGCEPRTPWNPIAYIKFLTLPEYACNYRMRGPGANPEAAKAVLNTLNWYDGLLLPPPLMLHYWMTFWWGKVCNVFTYFLGMSDTKAPFPKWWQYMISKRHILHGATLRFQDLFTLS